MTVAEIGGFVTGLLTLCAHDFYPPSRAMSPLWPRAHGSVLRGAGGCPEASHACHLTDLLILSLKSRQFHLSVTCSWGSSPLAPSELVGLASFSPAHTHTAVFGAATQTGQSGGCGRQRRATCANLT